MTDSDQNSPLLTPEERRFFQEIEERFCALRGLSRLLSPRDWALIDSWWQRGIPLPLILETMGDVFKARERRGDTGEQIQALGYVKSEVERRWRLRCEITSHRRGAQEEEERLRREIRRHLGRVARGLHQAAELARGRQQEPLAKSLLLAEAELKSIRKEIGKGAWDPLKSEKQMEKLEANLLQNAFRSLEPSERVRLDRETLDRLGSLRGGMSKTAWEETLGATRSRWVRHHFQIPQISLMGEG